LFGIAKPTKAFSGGRFSPGYYRDRSFLTVQGPESRVYWFLFENLPETVYYADKIPRYSKADEKEFAEKHWNDVILDDVTLGDLYSNSLFTNMTPLHEHVFDKWHFERIITIGDAAHKVSQPSPKAMPLELFTEWSSRSTPILAWAGTVPSSTQRPSPAP